MSTRTIQQNILLVAESAVHCERWNALSYMTGLRHDFTNGTPYTSSPEGWVDSYRIIPSNVTFVQLYMLNMPRNGCFRLNRAPKPFGGWAYPYPLGELTLFTGHSPKVFYALTPLQGARDVQTCLSLNPIPLVDMHEHVISLFHRYN